MKKRKKEFPGRELCPRVLSYNFKKMAAQKSLRKSSIPSVSTHTTSLMHDHNYSPTPQ